MQEQVFLKPYTTFQMGGPARYFCQVQSLEDLRYALDFAYNHHLPVGIIGAGCNMLVQDQELPAVIIKLAIKDLEVTDQTIYAGAGVPLSSLVAQAHAHDLVGLAWAPSVPASVGGAIRGNAGAFGGETQDFLTAVRVWRNGQVLDIPRDQLEFSYRYSSFKHPDNRDIILGAWFTLEKGDGDQGKKDVARYIQQKQQNQPVGIPCSGCIFQNYQGTITDSKLCEQFPELQAFNQNQLIPSGYLIDKAGLKGVRYGGVMVSEKHANYLLNPEKQARYEEVLYLISHIKRTVKDSFGVTLTEEAVYLHEHLFYI